MCPLARAICSLQSGEGMVEDSKEEIGDII